MEEEIPGLSMEQKARLFVVLQKAFMLGLIAGKNQLQQAQNPVEMVETAVANSIKNLGELAPGSEVSSFMSDLMMGMKTPK